MKRLTKQMLLSPGACYFYGLVLCVAVLGMAVYVEITALLTPCPLCQLQRYCFFIIGLLSLAALLQRPHRRGMQWYGGLMLVFTMAGIALASRQVWLELHPWAASENCSMGLSYLLNTFSISAAVKIALLGSGECAKVTWRLLGMSIPVWSLFTYSVLALLQLSQLLRLPAR